MQDLTLHTPFSTPDSPLLNEGAVDFSLAQLLTSLSYALDLTSGQPMGHAQRSCLIGMRIAALVGISDDEQATLYHALLLKDAGCSSNAARMADIFGCDDISAKRMSKITDWSNVIEAAKYVAATALPEKSMMERAKRILYVSTHQVESSTSLMSSRCGRGAQIALAVGLGEGAADCIRNLDEHWDGKGGPGHIKGDAIPMMARIACLAQTLEVFAKTFDVQTAYEIIRKRSGKWFDPQLVRAACVFEHDMSLWRDVFDNTRDALLSLDVRAVVENASASRIDTICDAFAQIVDAKSPFTAEHSFRVRDYAVEMGAALGMTGVRLTTLRRAALLHDLGKLAVSNTILDKPGKPTDEEWASIRKHPYYTQQILNPIVGFERLNEIAAAHHERLDGKGYFMGKSAEHLDLDMRILAVADVFDALSATRPYRGALPMREVFAILDKDAGKALDPQCIEVMRGIYADIELGPSEEPQAVNVSSPVSAAPPLALAA